MDARSGMFRAVLVKAALGEPCLFATLLAILLAPAGCHGCRDGVVTELARVGALGDQHPGDREAVELRPVLRARHGAVRGLRHRLGVPERLAEALARAQRVHPLVAADLAEDHGVGEFRRVAADRLQQPRRVHLGVLGHIGWVGEVGRLAELPRGQIQRRLDGPTIEQHRQQAVSVAVRARRGPLRDARGLVAVDLVLRRVLVHVVRRVVVHHRPRILGTSAAEERPVDHAHDGLRRRTHPAAAVQLVSPGLRAPQWAILPFEELGIRGIHSEARCVLAAAIQLHEIVLLGQ
mmetsp:Transcript_80620/g.246387  ORF Transcript_80620/g.246387 Transcript_80620/m.246387 type:complete len:292 (-) Transcript_80620:2-877(-)